MAPDVTALIVAAGSGSRLGSDGPKALVELAGRPLFEWSLAACRRATRVGPIVIAVPPGHEGGFSAGEDGVAGSEDGVDGVAGSEDGADGVTGSEDGADADEPTLVAGGATRALSVAAGLNAVSTDLVVVHDAARPLVTPDLIDASIAALAESPGLDAVIAAAPVSDTIKRVGRDGRIEATVDRSSLRAAQTPQVCRTAALRRAIAHGAIERDGPGDDGGDPGVATDDASLIEAAGGSVGVIDGPPGNIKVTVTSDLALAALLLARQRSGQGNR